MKQTTVGGSRKKIINALMMTGLIVIFIAYMFPFVMVVINSLKQKRDIIKSPFSWLFTIKGLSFDNFVKAFCSPQCWPTISCAIKTGFPI